MLSPMLILERALESFIYLPCSCYLCDWRKGRYLGRADDEGNDLKFWNKRRLLESGIETHKTRLEVFMAAVSSAAAEAKQ